MKLVKLTATDFLSFKSLDYNFQDTPILIQGENLSDPNQESNGSGKSAIQSAIEFCIFKSTSRKVRDIELINFNADETYLSLSIYCPFREQEMLIERKVMRKGGGMSQLSFNGIVKYAFEDKMANEIDKTIIEWIGISKEDLQNYFIVNKERFKSIFSSSNTDKVALINRFSNAQLIKGVDKLVEDDIKSLQSAVEQIKYNKSRLIGSVQTLFQEKKDELSRDLSKEREEKKQLLLNDIQSNKEEIEELQWSINIIEGEREKIEKKITSNQRSIKKLSKITSNFKSLDVDEDLYHLKEKIKSTEEKGSKIEDKLKYQKDSLSELDILLREVEKNLAGEVVCPKCKHRFSLSEDIDIYEEEQRLSEIELLRSSTDILIDNTTEEISKYESEVSVLYDQKSDLLKKVQFNDRWNDRFRKIKKHLEEIDSSLSSQITEIDRSINKKKASITSINDSNTQLQSSIDNLKELSLDQVRIDSLNQKMREHGKTLQGLNKSIRDKQKEIFDTSQWIVNFKKFNMYLANQSLKVIQGYANKFLQDLKSDISIRWEGMKVLASGQTKEEITSYILRNGEQRDFWSFSGGERARLDYAMIFTLQTMINKTHKYGGLEFISTDEVGEGLDPQGLSDLMKALSNLQKTVLITTHVVNKSVSDNILLVRKANGVSEIIN